MPSAKFKDAARRIRAKLNTDYTPAETTPTAGPVGSGKLFIGGQVFDGEIGGVTQVVNVGRPAAAQYAAKVGGGTTVVSSGSATTTVGGGTGAAITSSFVIADPDALLTNARLLAVSAALSLTDAGSGGNITIGMATPPTLSASSTNDAATGSHAITASAAPGAAESLLKSTSAGLLTLPLFTATTSVTTPSLLSTGDLVITPTGGDIRANANLGISVDPAVRLHINSTASEAMRIESSSDTGSPYFSFYQNGTRRSYMQHSDTSDALILASEYGVISLQPGSGGTKAEKLQVHTSGATVTGSLTASTSVITPLLTTATNIDLVINPAGTGAVQFPNDQTLRTSSFDSSFPINGWQINEVAGISGYSALTIGKIQADELAVRVFVADEVRVDRGDEFWTKSYGIVAETFTTPGFISGTVSIMFEDSPALAGAIFTNNDWVLIRKLDIDTGITLSNIWGQVATYVNNSDGTQSWTFTLRSEPTSESVTKGSLAIDFGASGAALIHLSVIDAAGAPYIKMRKWAGANPYTPSNFTTYVQIGQLGSIGNSYVTPAGYGLYIRSTANEDQFIVADDNGLQIRGADIKLYNGADQTVNLSYTGTDVWVGLTSSDKRLSWNGTTLSVKGAVEITAPSNFSGSGYLQVGSGTKDSTLDGFNMNSSEFVGQLDGVDQVVMGTNGKITAGAGAVWLDAVGLNVSVVGVGTPTYIRFDNSTSTVGSIGYLRTAGPTPGANDGMIFNNAETTKFRFIGASSTEFGATVNVTGYVTATTGMSVGGTAVSLDGHTHSYLPLSGGTVTGSLTAQNITFATDNTYDIGAADKRIQDLYAVNLHVNTIVGEPAYSHHHAASDIDSGTLDFARMATTWNGALTLDADTGITSNYVRWLTQTSTGKAWDMIGRAHDYATTPAQQNDLLLTYYDGSSTYIVLQADNATRVVDFLNTPTVGGTALVPGGRTVSAGSGLTGGGALSANITISHDDTSSQASVNNSDTTFIQDVTLDGFGHVTALGSVDISTALDALYVNVSGDTMTGTLTVAGGSLISLFSGSTGGAIVQGILDTETSFARAWFGHNAEWDGSGNLWNIDNVGANDTAGFLIPNSSSSIQLIFHASSGASSRTMDHATFIAGEKFRFTNAGKFGVLNISPTYEVDATGSIRATVSVLTPTVTTTSGSLTLTSAGGTVAVTGALTANSTVAVTTSVSTPSLITASGNLSINPAGGTTAITGALTGSSTAAFTTSVSTPTVTTASGNLTLTSTGGTVAITGALTGSSTGVFTSTLTAASDTDAINTFGRVRLGYAAATDTASFAHFDQNTSTNFALSQGAAGVTVVNAASGQTISLSNAGSATATIGASGIDLQSGKYVGSSNYASQSAGWRVDALGGGDFRYLYADQMHVKAFIADLEQALAGSQIVTKSVAVLASDFIVPYAGGTQLLTVEDLPSASNMAVFESGDLVAMRSFSRAGGSLSATYCYGTVASYSDGTGVQTWTFTRSGTTTYNTITQRGSATSATTSSGNSVAPNKPTGLLGGDKMLAVVTHDGSADTITATGWTIIGEYTSGTDINFAMYYRVAGGTVGVSSTDGSTYTFSTVSNHALAASVVAYYNVDSLIIDDYSISTNGASTNMTGTTVFGTATANMLVFLGGITNNSASTPPSGMTELIDAGSSGIRVYVAHQTLAASGETGSKVATIAASHASIVGMVALRPTYSAMSATAGAAAPGDTIETNTLALDLGVSGNGYYEVSTVDGTYGANSPYAQVVTWTTHPITASVVRTRMGNLKGLFAAGDEYGLYAGNGTSTTSNYLRLSNVTSAFNNIPISMYNAGTQTVNIDSSGTNVWIGPSSSDKRFLFNGTALALNKVDITLYNGGTQTVNIDSAGTNIWVGPSSGDKRLSWNGTTLSVVGAITIASGSSGYSNFSDKPTTLNSINSSEYTKINSGLDSSGNLITKVLPGSTVGTPGGAGLFLGSDKMGYYNGSRWLTYMDNSGNFTFSSATSAKLAWDGTDLYGTDGSNVQWYARASTGKFYAGNGAVVLDRTGILVANDATSAGITLHRTNAFSSSTKSGRLWALSDLSPRRIYFSAGRSVGVDGDASSAAGIMDLVAYNSSGAVAAELSLDGDGGVISAIGAIGEAWTNASYNTGWGSYGGGYHAAQYKKFGDLVFLRGLVVRSSGSAITIFTLPSGYRPTNSMMFSQLANDAVARIGINTSGTVVLQAGVATPWVNLTGIIFSTA